MSASHNPGYSDDETKIMTTSDERRAPSDRRGRDAGPPAGWRDRRRNAERRLPLAEEAEMSADEFARYFGCMTASPCPSDGLLDQAAEVFDRVRKHY
ncbi:MAG: hypothetical protein ACM3X0_07445 [Bacteroidota bacterium]